MQIKKKDAIWAISLSIFLVIISAGVFWSQKVNAAAAKDKPYQAIVKVNTYTLNEFNDLSLFASGSGIIFDASGLVLTNYHVTTIEEEFDNTQKETSFQICLTQDPNLEPNCDWVGQLVAKDKDLDVAILQIRKQNSDASTAETFPYLDLDKLNASVTNDKITVLGYPGIGDETITITEGIISGKVNKYNSDWLKTDAVISFGSSGGAAINKYGYVIGLISQAHSDLLGSLGYLINMSSLRSWIDTNKTQVSQAASFENRIHDLSAKQKAIKNVNTFQNDKPAFSITKPADWDFDYQNENSLLIHKKTDDDGGAATIVALPFPIPMSTDFVMTVLKKKLVDIGALSLLSVNKDEDITVNGLSGKKITMSIMGETQSVYYFVLDNYLLEINYDYGYAEKDKAIIEEIINSVSGTPGESISPVLQYENKNPKFYISANEGWSILGLNAKENVVEMYNIDEPNAYLGASVTMLEGSQKDFTNDDYLAYIKSMMETVNSTGAMLDIKFEITESNAHYKLNDELTDTVMMGLKVTKPSTGAILAMSTDYSVRAGDYYIDVDLSMFTDDATQFQALLVKVGPILSSLSLIELKNLNPEPAAEVIAVATTTPSILDKIWENKMILFAGLILLLVIILVIVLLKVRAKRKAQALAVAQAVIPQAAPNPVNNFNQNNINQIQ